MLVRRSLTSLSVACLVWTASVGMASAQGAESGGEVEDPAKDLFLEGRALMQERRYAEACPKLEQSQKLRPGVGTLFNLATCNAEIGKLGTAYKQLSEVIAETEADGDAERTQAARDAQAALEPRLMKIHIDVPPNSQLEVRVDGEIIPPEQFGSAIPFDRGQHTVVATGPGQDPFQQSVNLMDEGAKQTVTIPYEPVEGSDEEEEESGGGIATGRVVAGSILMGVGVIALGTGVAALANSDSALDEDTAIGVGIAGVAVGAACLGPGIPLFISGLTAGGDDEEDTSASAQLSLTVGVAQAHATLIW